MFVIAGLLAIIGLSVLLITFLLNSSRRSKYRRLFISLKEKQIDLTELFRNFTFVAAQKNFSSALPATKVEDLLMQLKNDAYEEGGVQLKDVIYIEDLSFCLLTCTKKQASYIPGSLSNYFSVNVYEYTLCRLQLSTDLKKAIISSETKGEAREKVNVRTFAARLLCKFD
ncbi:MAG: hypothetical protein M3R17_04600 [Bacteroidota bacterium]|nr:hypothetical protein [Bacteroidota bacterium]